MTHTHRYLAFQGSLYSVGGSKIDSEHRDSKREGNFMALVRFVAEFDPVLKDHLERSKEGAKGRATYLSPLIQNEFIAMLGNSVREKLVGDVKERYMNLEGKDAESIEEGIRTGLQSFGLDFNNCRAVCFDNAGAMFLAFLSFWTPVLRKFDVQKRLKCPEMTFKDAYEDLQALAIWLQENRDTSAQEAVIKSLELCNKWEVGVEIKRVRRQRCMPGELARDEPLTPHTDMKRKLLVALERLAGEEQLRSA
ncbi:uncharacterized protein [Palaemon carinicauda]|uniref:uncharacterized protein n=1 Tax=Palaemon carinicauda TaxID=392227 RepID=UPI0035B66344